MDAIAAALEPLQAVVDGLQVTGFQNANPTPPSLDVYPSGPSGVPAAQHVWEELFTVRARVSAPDDVGAQQVLLSLMDADGPASVILALQADPTFGGTVADSQLVDRSGFVPYPGVGGDWLGCEWRLTTV